MNVSMNKALLLAYTLMYASTANAETVVVVNPKNAATSMTAEQVANIFLGKDSSSSPVDLPESSTIRKDFYKKVIGKDAGQVKTIWARLIFTGKAQPPKQVGSPAEAVKHVAGNPKGIAYVDKSMVDESVKTVLTMN